MPKKANDEALVVGDVTAYFVTSDETVMNLTFHVKRGDETFAVVVQGPVIRVEE